MLSNDERIMLQNAIWRIDQATQMLIDARAKGATEAAERDCSQAQDAIAAARDQINRVLAGESQA